MIQVLERAAVVLKLLQKNGPCTLQALTEQTGLRKTTLSSILQTLVHLGFVVKREVGAYALGPELLALAALPLADPVLLELAEESVTRLTRLTGEHAVLGVLEGARVRYLACGWMTDRLMIRAPHGKTDLAYDAATGRLLLAFLDPEQRERMLSQAGLPGERWPEADAPEALAAQLATIRKTAIAWRQTPDHLSLSVAVPVQRGGRVAASLGLAVPTVRMQGEYRERMIAILRQEAERVNARLNSL